MDKEFITLCVICLIGLQMYVVNGLLFSFYIYLSIFKHKLLIQLGVLLGWLVGLMNKFNYDTSIV